MGTVASARPLIPCSASPSPSSSSSSSIPSSYHDVKAFTNWAKGQNASSFFFFFLPTKKRNDVCVAYEEELCVSSVCNSIPDTQNDSQGNDFEQKARLSTLSLALVH